MAKRLRLYQTREDDMIDLIAWQHYGVSSGFVEQILEINRGDKALGLSNAAPVLPRGVPILLPEIEIANPRTLVNLWD